MARPGPMQDIASVKDKDGQLYKVLVIGDYAVGKTSLIRRYTEGVFTPNYKLTIGVDFAVKTLQWTDGSTINLQLWDIAGHERFGCMTHVYYKYAIAAVIVFDLTRPATFEAVLKWKEDLDSKVMLSNSQPVPCILIANKCDRDDIQVDRDRLDQFCKEHNFVAWFQTSALENTGIEPAMNALVEHVVKIAKDAVSAPRPGESLNLKARSPLEMEKEKSGCCADNMPFTF